MSRNGTLYGVVVRDGDLFLFWRIRRSDKGDVYVLFPHDQEANPHASYHADGKHHQKSSDQRLQTAVQRQRPDNSFQGVENVVCTGIAAGDAQAINVKCQASDFAEVLEIDHNFLVPTKFKTYLSVDLTDSNGGAGVRFGSRVVDQKTFKDRLPWILLTFYE